MHKVLLIQFRLTESAVVREQKIIRQRIGASLEVEALSAFEEAVDWNNPEAILSPYSGVILGGSGDLDFDGGRAADDKFRAMSYETLERLRPLLSYLFTYDIPTLGICYGHQMIGAYAGARIHADPQQKKIRSHKVTVVANKTDHAIFSDLPNEFVAHYGHKDVLDRVPEGACLIMQGGDACQVSALRYQTNIFTVQFHPELTATEMVDRIKNSPGYMPHGGRPEEVFIDDPSSNKILYNFGRFIAAGIW